MPESLDEHEALGGIGTYLIGLGLATLLTIVSLSHAPRWSGSRAFPSHWPFSRSRRWVFTSASFSTSTTGPDNVNNVMALAFGVLIVLLVIAGSLRIMAHMDHNTMPVDQIMQMQR